MSPQPRITAITVGSSLDNKGGMISVIRCYQKAGFLDNQLYCVTHRDGGALERLALFISGLWQLLVWLIRYPDIRVVHLHTSERGSFFRKALVQGLAKTFGKKTLLHMHGAEFMEFYQGLPAGLRAWARHTLKSADAVIALSERWRSDLLSVCPEANVQVVYNPCEVQAMKRAPQAQTTFLFLGRLGQRKGAYDLVEAARLLQQEVPPNTFSVRMHGDGELEAVRQKVQENNLEDCVSVNSWLSPEEKEEALQKADVLVLPSYNEGLPMAILEALGYGLPVISTPVGGIAEAVEDGVNGYLVPPGNPQALAQAMRVLLESPQARELAGQASLNKAQKQFEVSQIVQRLNRLYNELISPSLV